MTQSLQYDPKPFVATGAALLDSLYKPNKPFRWYLEINLDELDMAEGCDCMLGQLFTDYLLGMKELKLDAEAPEGSRRSAVKYGFDIPSGSDAEDAERFALLRDAWAELITQRIQVERAAA